MRRNYLIQTFTQDIDYHAENEFENVVARATANICSQCPNKEITNESNTIISMNVDINQNIFTMEPSYAWQPCS